MLQEGKILVIIDHKSRRTISIPGKLPRLNLQNRIGQIDFQQNRRSWIFRLLDRIEDSEGAIERAGDDEAGEAAIDIGEGTNHQAIWGVNLVLVITVVRPPFASFEQ